MTNAIRNPDMTGAVVGTPGTLPTYWEYVELVGLSTQIVATGTQEGIPYIDIRFFGTSTGTDIILAFEEFGYVPVDEGDYWSLSAWLSIINGGTPDVGGTVLVSELSGLPVNDTLQRFWIPLAQADVSYIRPKVLFRVAEGDDVDFTVRIGEPAMILADMVMANTITAVTTMGSANSAYRILDTPQIEAEYDTEATPNDLVRVSVLNSRSAYKIRYYEAVGTRNNFTTNTQDFIGDDFAEFNHPGDEAKRAYKYKVSYFVTGNIGGSLVEHEGTRCAPVYLLGESE